MLRKLNGFVVGRHEARFQGLQDAPHVDPFIGLGSPVSASQRRHYVYLVVLFRGHALRQTLPT